MLALSCRPGKKWLNGIIVDKSGVNFYENYIAEQDKTISRHANQLLISVEQHSNGNQVEQDFDIPIAPRANNNDNNNVSNNRVDSESSESNDGFESFVSAPDSHEAPPQSGDDSDPDFSVNMPTHTRSGRRIKPVDRLNI